MMTEIKLDLTKLRSLRYRIQSTTAPNRELDAAICVVMEGSEKSFTAANAPDKTRRSYGPGAWFSDADNYHVLTHTIKRAPQLISSTIAALAKARLE